MNEERDTTMFSPQQKNEFSDLAKLLPQRLNLNEICATGGSSRRAQPTKSPAHSAVYKQEV